MGVANERPHGAPPDEWDHVDCTVREDERTNFALDELKAKYPAANEDPKNWRFDIVCGRGVSGESVLTHAVCAQVTASATLGHGRTLI